jgi:hypothetical protein
LNYPVALGLDEPCDHRVTIGGLAVQRSDEFADFLAGQLFLAAPPGDETGESNRALHKPRSRCGRGEQLLRDHAADCGSNPGQHLRGQRQRELGRERVHATQSTTPPAPFDRVIATVGAFEVPHRTAAPAVPPQQPT